MKNILYMNIFYAIQDNKRGIGKTMKIFIFLLILAVLIGLALIGTIMSNVEQPKYKIIHSKGSIELREYAPMVVAEVEVSGERKEAINNGFRILADYIFGNNSPGKKIAMSAPVTQQQGEKIAMSAPVTQQGDGNTWKVRFVMPESYTLETLPEPNSKNVTLIPIPAKRFAVIRFTGLAGDSSIKSNTEELQAYIHEQKLKPLSSPTFAFYNPPWTLPFLRRNEVMIEVE